MAQRIGILGGTFNPVHYGHLAAAEEVRDRLKLDRVLFIPVAVPPHKEEELPSAVQRLEMVRLAVAGHPQFRVSDLEIKRGGRSYTVDTLEALLPLHPGAELFFITGLDSFLEVRTWKAWERLLTLCSFVVISREGCRFRDLERLGFPASAGPELEALDGRTKEQATLPLAEGKVVLIRIPYYEISSTDIRERLRRGRSVKYHLPEQVEHYIIENKLYG